MSTQIWHSDILSRVFSSNESATYMDVCLHDSYYDRLAGDGDWAVNGFVVEVTSGSERSVQATSSTVGDHHQRHLLPYTYNSAELRRQLNQPGSLRQALRRVRKDSSNRFFRPGTCLVVLLHRRNYQAGTTAVCDPV